MIEGGYILQPRCFDASDASKFPPTTREIWFFILRNVNHSDNGKFRKGQKVFSYSDIQEGLCWYVGFIKKTYPKDQIAKALRRLHEGNMIAKTKATGGVLITVCNYEHYQTPKNYEGNNEGNAKATGRQQEGIHLIDNKKKKKEEEETTTPLTPLREYLENKIQLEGHQDIAAQIISFFKYRMAKPKAKQYQTEKGINGLFRYLAECRESGLNLFDCLEIAMEENWQTPKPDYFKNNFGGNNGKNNRPTQHNYTGKDNRPSVLPERDLQI